MQYPEVMRRHGRDDYPARAMWHVLLDGFVFQHESIESLLRELARNPSLIDACGFYGLPIPIRASRPIATPSPLSGVDCASRPS